MYSTRYVTFPDEATAPFAGVAAPIYALIVGRLVSSVMRNLRELGCAQEGNSLWTPPWGCSMVGALLGGGTKSVVLC